LEGSSARRRWLAGLGVAVLVLMLGAAAVLLIHPAGLYNEIQTLTWPRRFTPEGIIVALAQRIG